MQWPFRATVRESTLSFNRSTTAPHLNDAGVANSDNSGKLQSEPTSKPHAVPASVALLLEAAAAIVDGAMGTLHRLWRMHN